MRPDENMQLGRVPNISHCALTRLNYLAGKKIWQSGTGTRQCTRAVWSALEYIVVHFCTSVHSYAVHFIVHLSTL